MSSKSYIIPSDDLTFMDKASYRLGAIAAGIQRSFALGIAPWDKQEIPGADGKNPNAPSLAAVLDFLKSGGWPRGLDVRDFQPILDAGAALDRWQTAPLLVAGSEYSCLQAVTAAPAASRVKKLVVFYKVQIDDSRLPVSRLIFRRNTATGITQSEFDLEQLAAQIRLDGYLSEPVVWDNNTAYAVNVVARIATLVPANVILGNFTFEPAGVTNS